jgi:hypothetical protein
MINSISLYQLIRGSIGFAKIRRNPGSAGRARSAAINRAGEINRKGLLDHVRPMRQM